MLCSLLFAYVGPVVSDEVPGQVAAMDVPWNVDNDTQRVLRADLSDWVIEVSEGESRPT